MADYNTNPKLGTTPILSYRNLFGGGYLDLPRSYEPTPETLQDVAGTCRDVKGQLELLTLNPNVRQGTLFQFIAGQYRLPSGDLTKAAAQLD